MPRAKRGKTCHCGVCGRFVSCSWGECKCGFNKVGHYIYLVIPCKKCFDSVMRMVKLGKKYGSQRDG